MLPMHNPCLEETVDHTPCIKLHNKFNMKPNVNKRMHNNPLSCDLEGLKVSDTHTQGQNISEWMDMLCHCKH